MKRSRGRVCRITIVLSILIGCIIVWNNKVCYAGNGEQNGEVNKKLDEYLQTTLYTANVKGMAIEIVDSNDVMYSNTFGKAEKTSDNFLIGSMSKSFTALAVVDLAEQGKLDLDDSVCEYLDGFPELETVTVRDLLNQISGITSDQLLSNIKISDGKGQFHYANANYNLLGKIIEKVTGREYSEYVRERIFTPLEMTDTYADYGEKQESTLVQGYTGYFGIMIPRNVKYPDKDSWSQVPAGYIISNVDDMGKYLQMYLKEGASIFSSEAVNTVLHNGVDASTDAGVVSDMYGGDADYCMGWIDKKVKDETIIYHTGKVENYTSVMVLLPQRDLAVVMLFNTMDFLVGQNQIEEIEENVISIVRGEEIKEINQKTYLVRRVIINAVCLVLVLLSCLPILIFVKRRQKKKGNLFVAVILHVICPVLLICAFPAAGMPLFVVRGFVPDIFIVLVLSAIILVAGGVLKLVKR